MNGGLSRGQTAVCRTESRFYVKRDPDNYRFAFSQYLSSTPVAPEQYRLSAAYRYHGHLTPLRVSQSRPHCLSLWLDGSIIILLHFIACGELFRFQSRYLSLSLSRSWRIALWAAEVSTGCRINVSV